MDWKSRSVSYIAGTPFVGAEVVSKPGPGGNRGEFTAWDPVKGKAVWTIKEGPAAVERRDGHRRRTCFLRNHGWLVQSRRCQDRRAQMAVQDRFRDHWPACGLSGADGHEDVAILSGVGGWAAPSSPATLIRAIRPARWHDRRHGGSQDEDRSRRKLYASAPPNSGATGGRRAAPADRPCRNACRRHQGGGATRHCPKRGSRTNEVSVTSLLERRYSAPPAGLIGGRFDGNKLAIADGQLLFSQMNCTGCHFNGGGGMGRR